MQALAILSLLFSTSAFSQRRVCADVEVKTVYQGHATTVHSKTFISLAGRQLSRFESPYLYYSLTNPGGEFKIYIPGKNEVYTDRKDDYSNKDDVLYICMTGRLDDMGLSSYGYSLRGSIREEDGYLKRTYAPTKPMGGVDKVELVLKDYLPVYIAYYSGNAIVAKTYLSSYQWKGRLAIPSRITAISYTGKKDSLITRTIYSDIQVDGTDPLFEFEIPAGAKPIFNRP